MSKPTCFYTVTLGGGGRTLSGSLKSFREALKSAKRGAKFSRSGLAVILQHCNMPRGRKYKSTSTQLHKCIRSDDGSKSVVCSRMKRK